MDEGAGSPFGEDAVEINRNNGVVGAFPIGDGEGDD
jgi:hypothetical protein